MQWDVGVISLIIGIILAALGISVTIWYGRKALPPRQELQWECSTDTLLATDKAPEGVEITIQGERVLDPYITRIQIANTGSRDLDSDAFDRHRPIRFTLPDVKRFYLLKSENMPRVVTDNSSILVGPDLLESQKAWNISVLSDGPTQPALTEKYLPNFPVTSAVESQRRRAAIRRFLVAASTVVILGSIVAGLAVWLSPSASSPTVTLNSQPDLSVSGDAPATLSGTVSGLDGRWLWMATGEDGSNQLYLAQAGPVAIRDGAWSVRLFGLGNLTNGREVLHALSADSDCSARIVSAGTQNVNAQRLPEVLPGCTDVFTVVVIVKSG